MTSTPSLGGAPQAGSPRVEAGAAPQPITCVDGTQKTPQDTLKTVRLGVKEGFFPCVFGCMDPETQAKIKENAKIFDPAVQAKIMASAGAFVARVTDQVRSESPTEVTFKMTPEGTTEFAKFVLIQDKWYMG